MSLIVARRNSQEVIIVGDTKLIYNSEAKSLKDQPQNGTIKIIVLSDHLCVAFAGDVFFAVNVLSGLDKKSSVDEVINSLLQANLASGMLTDFIVATGKPNTSLYKIQNGQLTEGDNAWIGDYSAFEYFQMAFHGGIKEDVAISPSQSNESSIIVDRFNMSMSFASHSDLGTKMAGAMDRVIENMNIESVGGFRIQVVLKERFYYDQYLNLYNGNLKFPLFGEHILGHGDAQHGGYTVNFIGPSDDNKIIAIHIAQANLGVTYELCDSIYKPIIHKQDEVDFYEFLRTKYGILPSISTQDAFSKFWSEANAAFQKNEFHNADRLLEKAIKSDEVSDQPKDLIAECYCMRGYCQIRLNNPPLSMDMFQNAIRLNPEIQKKIMQIIFSFKSARQSKEK